MGLGWNYGVRGGRLDGGTTALAAFVASLAFLPA